MASTVTLDIFSGRENPVLHLDPGQEDELDARLRSLSRRTDRRPSGVFGGLGYRGFRISRPSTHPIGGLSLQLHEGVVDGGPFSANLVDDDGLESWLLGLMGQSIPPGIRDHVQTNIAASTGSSFALQVQASACPTVQAADAPPYNPARWNTPAAQPHNNCYNYANDQMTNSFAQPGRASGHPIGLLDCPDVQASATSDGLVAVGSFAKTLTAGQGWYVALVVWPGVDYHWYRQDDNGCWSHKPGQTAARNVDNSGHNIPDPQTCDRGPYSDFCSYMVTGPGVTIS